MSAAPIISLSSSDEEDNKASEPPSKKRKVSPVIVPNVTLSLVPKTKTPQQIECVSLDSDDESKSSGKATQAVTAKAASKDVTTKDINKMIDSILKGHNSFKRNGLTIFRNKSETVLLIDSDSDTELKKDDVKKNAEQSRNEEAGNRQQNNKKRGKGKELLNGKHDTVEGSRAIVIADSDDEVEEKENQESLDVGPNDASLEDRTSLDESSSSSVSKDEASQEAKSKFEAFLTIVIDKLAGSSFEDILPKKVPIMKKYFQKCGTYVNGQNFLSLLHQTGNTVKQSPTCDAANGAVLAFHKIFQHLKTHVKQSIIEIEEEDVPKVKKLEKVIKLLRKKIKSLEATEVDFDDDGDSSYIILDRYQNRLRKVYAKYCEYIRRNPYSGRPIYDKISFVHSKYNEINQALSRKYRNSAHFPSYYEVEKYIQKTVNKAKLDLSEQEIKHESKKCFKHLGSILQKKRRQELYDCHLDFIESTEDPAVKDVTLENTLKKNSSKGKENMDKLCQTFVVKQEKGEDQISSDDDEKSSESSNESEIAEVTSKPVSGDIEKVEKEEDGSESKPDS